MSDVTQILNSLDPSDPRAAEHILPLVYAELRRLAAAKLAQERPGQTLDATALVHEAYLRMAGEQTFENRRHFFAAASESMRRILVEAARRKARLRHGGAMGRVELDDVAAPDSQSDDVLAVDEVLDQLAAEEPEVAAVVKLRFFVGLTAEEAAETLGISLRTANRHWSYAKAWLVQTLGEKPAIT